MHLPALQRPPDVRFNVTAHICGQLDKLQIDPELMRLP